MGTPTRTITTSPTPSRVRTTGRRSSGRSASTILSIAGSSVRSASDSTGGGNSGPNGATAGHERLCPGVSGGRSRRRAPARGEPRLRPRFRVPWGTLVVNVVGSFAMGALAGWLAFKAGTGWSQPVRLFLTTGVLGGFTTFSAFSLDAVLLWERHQLGLAVLYIIGSVGLSILGLLAGLALVRHFS